VEFGPTNTALEWIRSYRTQQVSYRGRLPPMQRVLFGVAHVLYTAELEKIVARHGLCLHMYADDCQV